MYPAVVHRGRHAWGYMYHEQGQSDVDYFVKSGSATHRDAVADMDFTTKEPLNWMAGHVRFATNGSPAYLPNNHPMVHRSFIGMHNGVLTGWRDIINETGRQDPKAEVDSEAIFAAVNKWGVLAGLKRVHGNMVSVFCDLREPGVIYIARTYGRPLWYATTVSGSLVWASEPQIITDTGLDLKAEPQEWKRINRVWKVVGGKVVSDRQFRKPEPKASEPEKRITAPPPRGNRPLGQVTPSSAFGSGLYKKDRWGGTYLGANMWKVNDGAVTVTLSAEKYIEHVVATQLHSQVEARAKLLAEDMVKQEVEKALLAKLHSLTQFLPGKTPASKPEPGELDDNLHISPDPVVRKDLAS
jgi:hypothetical protein